MKYVIHHLFMKKTFPLKYRGDFYQITYDTVTGLVSEVLLFPGSGRQGEELQYWQLPEQLQQLIQDEINE